MAEINSSASEKPPTGTPGVNRLDVGDKLDFESMKLLAEHGKLSFLVSLVNAAIVYFVLRPLHQFPTMEIWLAVIGLASLARALMVVRFLQFDENDPASRRWLNPYLLVVFVSAACWGALPLLESFDSAVWSQTFIIFTVSGMSAGSLVSLYPVLRAAIPFLMIVIFPLIYTLAASAQPEQYAMAMLGSLYLLVLVRSTYILNAAARKSLRLELQNEELFDFLSATQSEDLRPLATGHDKPTG